MLSASAKTFLKRFGYTDPEYSVFIADASPRQYYRLLGEGRLLMEEKDNPSGFTAYLKISKHLNHLGLSAPCVYGVDPSIGYALIEDFGDENYRHCLAKGDERELYTLAIDSLLHLHHEARAKEVLQHVYDVNKHLEELKIFSQWFAPAVCPNVNVEKFNQQFLTLWKKHLQRVTTRFDTLVLRDFHIDNLMLLSNREGVRRCGLLDFQDGIIGPCEYDLVSLLQDARRDLAAGLEDEMLAYYTTNAPSYLGSAQEIQQRYALLGAGRHCRILGVFVRLCLRDNKPHYLKFLPRVIHQFKASLIAAELDDLQEFLELTLAKWNEVALQLKIPQQ